MNQVLRLLKLKALVIVLFGVAPTLANESAVNEFICDSTSRDFTVLFVECRIPFDADAYYEGVYSERLRDWVYQEIDTFDFEFKRPFFSWGKYRYYRERFLSDSREQFICKPDSRLKHCPE